MQTTKPGLVGALLLLGLPCQSMAQPATAPDCKVTPVIASFERTTRIARVNLSISTKDRLSTALTVTVDNASDLDQDKTIQKAINSAKGFLAGVDQKSFMGAYYSEGTSQFGAQYGLPISSRDQNVSTTPIVVVAGNVPSSTTNAGLLTQLIDEAIEQSTKATHYGCFRDAP